MSRRVTELLYIGGVGRSGSTVLEMLLHRSGHFRALGEVAIIDSPTIAEDPLCSCGERFSRCPYWSCVLASDRLAPQQREQGVAALRRHYRLRHYLPRLLWPRMGASAPAELARARQYLARLYAAAAACAPGERLLDGSKHPARALALAQTPGLQLWVLHLVRDPRAVVHSWANPKYNPGLGRPMRRYSLLVASGKWLLENLLTELLRWRGCAVMRLRYEDLVNQDAAALARLAHFVGLDEGALRMALGAEPGAAVRSGDYHSLAGNPIRFGDQALALRRDERFRTAMPPWRRLVVLLLTAPLALRYGYLRP